MLQLIRAREIRLMWDGDKVCALPVPISKKEWAASG